MNITQTLEPSLDYGGHLSQFLTPGHAAFFDTWLFNMVDRFTEDYHGGCWNMVIFKEEEHEFPGFYLQLQSDKRFNVVIDSNGYEGEMGADALSLVANLFLFNRLSWDMFHKGNHTAGNRFAELYHKLLEATYGHPEIAEILGAID